MSAGMDGLTKVAIEKIKAEVKEKFSKEAEAPASKADAEVLYKTSTTGRKFYVKRFSTADLAKFLGKRGMIEVSAGPYSRATLFVQVEVTDVRERYRHGKMDFEVTPVTGNGQAWVKAEDVTFKA